MLHFDTSNNINNTEITNFIAVDNEPPQIFAFIPQTGETFDAGDTIEIGTNVTDNAVVSFVSVNITFSNGTITTLNLTNAGGDKYNASFTIPFLIGQFNVTYFANDTDGNIATADSFFSTDSDNQTPQVIPLTPIQNSSFNTSDTIEISANVTLVPISIVSPASKVSPV